MAITQAQVLAAVAAEIPRIMQDGFERELQGRPDFIANGTPESIVGKIAQEGARSACRQYGANPDAFPGDKAVNAETACRPYLDGIGQGAAPKIATPFSGGQCPVNYTVEVRGTVNVRDCGTGNITFTGQGFNASAGIRGPISGLRLVGTGGGACGPTGSEVRGTNGLGQPFSFPGLNGTSASNTVFYTGVTFTLLRDDGQQDTCGDPPPEVTQPQPEPDPTPPPFRFNPIPGIDIPIDVTIAPDGKIGINFGVGDVTIDPFADRTDGGGDDGGGGGPPTPPPGDVGAPGTPVGTGVGGDAEGEAPPGSVLVGLKVQITAFPSERNRLQGGALRGAYYAYMGAPGLLDSYPDGAAAIENQFIYAQIDNLTAWRVRANNGYATLVTPYYRAIIE